MLFLRNIIINEQLIDRNLLVNPADHNLLIDRLVLPADKITVEIHIHIIHCLYIWQRVEHKNVIHIKRVFWQFQPAIPQQVCPVDDRVHQNVLPYAEMPYIFPCKDFLLRQRMGIFHNLLALLTLLLIHIVADKHVYGLSTF